MLAQRETLVQLGARAPHGDSLAWPEGLARDEDDVSDDDESRVTGDGWAALGQAGAKERDEMDF